MGDFCEIFYQDDDFRNHMGVFVCDSCPILHFIKGKIQSTDSFYHMYICASNNSQICLFNF